MITDEQIQAAFDFLEDARSTAPKARADRIQLEKFEKVVLARLRRDSTGKTVQERDDYALTHPDYEEWLSGYVLAVESDENFRWQKDRALALLDAWRTASANERGILKI